jgi:hypothetical protein
LGEFLTTWIEVLNAIAPSLGADEFHRHAARLEQLDGVEVARADVDLALLEQRGQRARVGGHRGQVGLELVDGLEAGLDVGLAAAEHLGHFDQPAGAQRGVQVVMPTRPLNSGFQRSFQLVGGVLIFSGL